MYSCCSIFLPFHFIHQSPTHFFFFGLCHKWAALSKLDFLKQWQINIQILEVRERCLIRYLYVSFNDIICLVMLWKEKKMDYQIG
jgi:hypothetical protein